MQQRQKWTQHLMQHFLQKIKRDDLQKSFPENQNFIAYESVQ